MVFAIIGAFGALEETISQLFLQRKYYAICVYDRSIKWILAEKKIQLYRISGCNKVELMILLYVLNFIKNIFCMLEQLTFNHLELEQTS